MLPSSLPMVLDMTDIWDVVAELAFTLHPNRVMAIAAKIESLRSSSEFASARSAFGPNIDVKLIQRLENAWMAQAPMKPAELAAALRGASSTARLAEHREAVELVWSGPSTGLVPVRHTEQVLCEVIELATKRLFIVSFVAYEISSVISALKEAVERKVRVEILLESSTASGGIVTTDSVKTMRNSVPGADLYIWSTDADQPGPRPANASVHAKCIVADANVAFVTSANLTSSAMERNMELGVLVRGGSLPDSLHRHLDALVATGVVKKV
jgi:cardiolipin synthase A/B